MIVGLSELQGGIPLGRCLLLKALHLSHQQSFSNVRRSTRRGKAKLPAPSAGLPQRRPARTVCRGTGVCCGWQSCQQSFTWPCPLPAGGLPTQTILQLVAVVLIAVLLAAWQGCCHGVLSRRMPGPWKTSPGRRQRSAAGDLHQQLEEKSEISELNSLGRSFNHMTESLRQADQAKTCLRGGCRPTSCARR